MKNKTTIAFAQPFGSLNVVLAVLLLTLFAHLGIAQALVPDNTGDVASFSTIINSTNPAGTILAIAGETRPVGYLFCNGKELLRSDYPDLFAAIGTTYGGSGDKFNLPDFRGLFLRGFNGSAGYDTDRKDANKGVGTYQADEFKSHSHTMENAGKHKHRMNGLARSRGSDAGKQGGGVRNAETHNKDTEEAGEHKHTINATGGSETRPKNIAVAYYIKATNAEAFNGSVGIGTTEPTEKMDVRGNIYTNGNIISEGNVGIGTTSPSEKLEVSGTIKADGVRLDVCSFPDYVFTEAYTLLPLPELATYIERHGHLPGMPSETEVLKKGMDLAQVNLLLVEKVEELTLHTLAQERKLTAQKTALATQNRAMAILQKEIAQVKTLLEKHGAKD